MATYVLVRIDRKTKEKILCNTSQKLQHSYSNSDYDEVNSMFKRLKGMYGHKFKYKIISSNSTIESYNDYKQSTKFN